MWQYLYWLYFLIFCILDILALGALIQERLPLPGRTNKWKEQMTLFLVCLWHTNQPVQSSHLHLSPLSNAHTSHYFPLPQVTLEPGTGQLGLTSTAQNLSELFKLSNRKLTQGTWPLSLIPSWKNPSEGSGPRLPSSLLHPDPPGLLPCGPERYAVPPLSKDLWLWHSSFMTIIPISVCCTIPD